MKEEDFAVGLNEFSGYFGVAIGGILVSYMTSIFSVKVALFLFSAIFILIALLYCFFLIEDTKKYANNFENRKSRQYVLLCVLEE